MINEGIYRSPKWLRNLLDFEINTGEDIKGEPSNRVKAKQAKDKIKEDIKRWDVAWDKLKDVNNFRGFLNTLIGDPIYFTITSYKLNIFREQFRGDFSIFEDFRKYLDKVEAEEKKKAELEKELRALIRRVGTDFGSAPYRDKISGYTNRAGEYCIKYKFENDDTIDVFDIKARKFKFSDGKHLSTFTLSSTLWNLLINEINHAQKIMRDRPRSNSYGYNRSSKTGSSYSSSSSSSNNSNPKWSKYKTILDTIELRKSQLSKMIKGSERETLENELKAAQRMADRMKKEYKFENIKSFNDFNSFNS